VTKGEGSKGSRPTRRKVVSHLIARGGGLLKERTGKFKSEKGVFVLRTTYIFGGGEEYKKGKASENLLISKKKKDSLLDPRTAKNAEKPPITRGKKKKWSYAYSTVWKCRGRKKKKGTPFLSYVKGKKKIASIYPVNEGRRGALSNQKKRGKGKSRFTSDKRRVKN